MIDKEKKKTFQKFIYLLFKTISNNYSELESEKKKIAEYSNERHIYFFCPISVVTANKKKDWHFVYDNNIFMAYARIHGQGIQLEELVLRCYVSDIEKFILKIKEIAPITYSEIWLKWNEQK